MRFIAISWGSSLPPRVAGQVEELLAPVKAAASFGESPGGVSQRADRTAVGSPTPAGSPAPARQAGGRAQFTANQATFVLAATALLRWMVNDPGDPVTI